MLEPVLPALELPQVPVLGDQRRAQRPDLARPVAPRRSPRTRPAPSHAHSGVSRGSSLSISASATAALRDRHPRRQHRLGQQRRCAAWPIASVTCTSAAAPPAAVGGAPLAHPPGRRRRVRGPHVPTGQPLVQHPDLTGLGQHLQLVQLGEHRPQPVRARLVQPAQRLPQQPHSGGHRRPVLLEAGPLHEPNLAATTDRPLGAESGYPQGVGFERRPNRGRQRRGRGATIRRLHRSIGAPIRHRGAGLVRRQPARVSSWAPGPGRRRGPRRARRRRT